jgi:ligand-binding sensor domain-containing protein
MKSGPPMTCTQQEPPGLEPPVWDIDVVRDEAWLVAYRGVARLDLTTGDWTVYTEENGLPFERGRTVTVGADGTVWVPLREEYGVAYFNGRLWQQITEDDGLLSDDVMEVSLAPDGTVWFATAVGASQWDRETDTWTQYTVEDGLLRSAVARVLFTPEGRIWFAQLLGLTSLLPAPMEQGENLWQNHWGSRFVGGRNATVDDDGRLWVGAAVFDPAQDAWFDTVYRDLQTNGLAVDGRGGLWVARPDGALYLPDPKSSPREDWLHYGPQEGLVDPQLLALALETDEVVWFGTRSGAWRCAIPGTGRPASIPTPEVMATPVE